MTAYAVGGRLRHFWRKWAEMGVSRRVVRWLKFGMLLRFSRKVVRERWGFPHLARMSLPPPLLHLIAHYQDLTKQNAFQMMVEQLNSETVYSRNVSRRVQFLLESVS